MTFAKVEGSSLHGQPLVSVVVPAFNAVETLARTLESIMAQTYRHLEILVVDDGSKDGTCELAEKFAQRDARIRVLTKMNGGVASARNLGILEAKGEYVAPVDADDLWHPTKIEKQLRVMLASGPGTGFVYCCYRTIDEDDRVKGDAPVYQVRGRVLNRHVLVNFVGNGSALLMRRAAALECGGYDTSLREQGLQGAEDFLLQLQLASRYHVEVVPEYLVGYRRSRNAMSEDVERMALSYIMAHKKLQAQCDHVPEWSFRWGAAPYMAGCALRAARRGRILGSLKLLFLGVRLDATGALDQVVSMLWERTPSFGQLPLLFGKQPARPQGELNGRLGFFDYEPTYRLGGELPWLLERRLKHLESYDLAGAPNAAPP
jgi:glycosyltransferase involved in cell wall biosynthesis